jgi:hypothetical protein
MLIFKNPGLIDMAAVTTMGVSVKNAGAFGYFGTGLKYSIATILRGGGTIHIYCGLKKYVFSLKPIEIRGENFDLVCLNTKPIGFTSQLGRNWQPWMVLRELGCNTKDEAGDFFFDKATDPEDYFDTHQDRSTTTILVWWNELDKVYDQRSTIFCESEVLQDSRDGLKILAGPSNYLYYRGVRVYELQQPSTFTYDILQRQDLTEDRTLAYSWNAQRLIRDTLLQCEDTEILTQVLINTHYSFESKIDFEDDVEPSRQFVDVVLDAREKKLKGLSISARALVMKLIRRDSDERVGYAHYRTRVDRFSETIAALFDLGLDINDDISVIVVDELPNEAKSLTENGRIYVLRSLLNAPKLEIATQLATRLLDLEHHVYADDMRDRLLPLLLRQHDDFRNEPKGDIPDETVKTASVKEEVEF